MILLVFGSLFAQTPKDIIAQAQEKQKADNSIQLLEMTLTGKNGKKQVRELEIKMRRDSDALRSYTRFIKPKQIAGTQLLFVDRPNLPDPQLIYLPALKCVQRISGSKKHGSFMGSDFTFSDLEFSLNGDEEHILVSETPQQWVIETRVPKHKLYAKWVTTIHKADMLPHQIEYYARNSTLLKTFRIQSTMTVNGRLIPQTTQMQNHKKGSATVLHIKEIAIDVSRDKLPDHIFTPAYLESND